MSELSLRDYSTAVKEIIRGNPGKQAEELVKTLPDGVTSKAFGFAISGKTIKILSGVPSLWSVFEVINRISPQKDYDFSMRGIFDGKTKVISKRANAKMNTDELKREMFVGGAMDRIFYETIITEEFQIKFSEYEGTILQTNDEETARRYFQLLVGLFPFVESEKDTKQAKIECVFNIEKWDSFRKEQKKRGTLKCTITLDGNMMGTKGNSFVF